jgi:hypothetical protein
LVLVTGLLPVLCRWVVVVQSRIALYQALLADGASKKESFKKKGGGWWW